MGKTRVSSKCMNIKQRKPKRGVRALGVVLLAAASFVPVQAGTFNNNFNTDPGAAVTLDGSAKWVNSGGGAGYIYLTGPAVMTPAEQGTMTIPDFDSGAAIGGFTATFKLQIGPGTGNAADGLSFNWGSDVPAS